MNRSKLIMGIGGVLLAVFAIAGITGCSSSDEGEPDVDQVTGSTVVGMVDDLPVTVADVADQYVKFMRPNSRGQASPENAWDEAVYFKMATLKARTFDDFDPAEVHRLVNNRLHDIVMGYMFDDMFSGKQTVTEAEIDSVWKATEEQYVIPERRVVTHLLSSNNPKAWSTLEHTGEIRESRVVDSLAHAKAAHLYNLIKEGANLEVLVAEHSHDTQSKETKGKVGPFAEGDMVDEFSGVVFKMKIGEISKPFKSIYGWHIVRLDSILPEQRQELTPALRESIRNQLLFDKQVVEAQKFVDSVAAKAEFVWNDKLLNMHVDEYDPYDWVCIVNGTDSIPASILREHEMMYRVRNRTAAVTPEIRKGIVAGFFKPFVLSSAARKFGYFDTDTIKTAYGNLRLNEIRNRVLRRRVPESREWTEEEKRKYYNDHIDHFMAEKPVQIRQIFVEEKETADKVVAELRAGKDFEELLEEYNEGEDGSGAETKAIATEPGWISEDDVPEELFNRAWTTNVGNVSSAVATKYGYHIVKVLDKRPRLPYESAGTELLKKMREESYERAETEWREWVSDGVEVKRYEKVFSRIDFNNPWQYQRPVTLPTGSSPEPATESQDLNEPDTLAAGGNN